MLFEEGKDTFQKGQVILSRKCGYAFLVDPGAGIDCFVQDDVGDGECGFWFDHGLFGNCIRTPRDRWIEGKKS